MKVLVRPEILSGFLCEDPFPDLPAFTHCGEALATPNFELPRHHHRGFEFLYLVRGSVEWQVGHSRFTQQMGDLFIAYPDEPHRTTEKFKSDMYNFWVGLDLEALGQDGVRLAGMIRKKQLRILRHCYPIEPVLRALVGAVVTPLPNQRQVILAYLAVFFALIEQQQQLKDSGGDANVRAHVPHSYMVQKVTSYMKRHLDRRLPLVEMARVANVRNTSYFGHRFRKEVAMTPAACHLRMRLEAARDCLSQPSMDITSVALQHGFSSSQHFSTLFRQAFGVTPLKWKTSRENSRGSLDGSPPGGEAWRIA
jgi:AraC-like DNA-binding protein